MPVVGTYGNSVISQVQNFTCYTGDDGATMADGVVSAGQIPTTGVSSAWSLGGEPAVEVKVVTVDVFSAWSFSLFRLIMIGIPFDDPTASYREVVDILGAITMYAAMSGDEFSSTSISELGGSYTVIEYPLLLANECSMGPYEEPEGGTSVRFVYCSTFLFLSFREVPAVMVT